MATLTRRQLFLLIDRYIGVSSAGYLGDFSYRTHREFYLNLDLDIDPELIPGTTRHRFQTIVSESTSDVQAKIIRGILDKYPLDPEQGRTQDLRDELARLADDLTVSVTGLSVAVPVVETPSTTVLKALRDAEVLLQSSGPTSAVDRVHTAIHAYLLALCSEVPIVATRSDTAQRLLVLLIDQHVALADLGARAEETKRILRSMVSVIDALGTNRNNATLAHPNDDLLGDPEARLAIDAGYTVMNYIERRRRNSTH